MRLLTFLRPYLTRPRLPLKLALLAILLTLPALWVGIQLDDNFHAALMNGAMGDNSLLTVCQRLFTFMDGDESYTRFLMNYGVLPWWTLEAVRGNFWRPLTALTHWIDYRLWPDQPWLMHLQSLLWFGALVAAVTVWYRRTLGPTWVAGLAALLYAIDDSHSMPVAWLANRNSVLATFFGVLTLIAHDRWRRDGWRTGAFLAPLFFELALFSAEAGVAAAGYLISYALFIDPGDRKTRLATLLPCGVVGVGWLVLHHWLGYGAWGMDLYIDPARDPLRYLLVALQRTPLLLLGALAVPPADISGLLAGRTLLISALVATALLGLLALAVRPVMRRDATLHFLALGMLLSVPAICATFPSDRLLMFVTMGSMGLVARFLAALVETTTWTPSRAVRALGLFLVTVHLLLAPALLPARSWAIKLIGSTLARPVLTFPNDDSLRDRELVLVNPPSVFVGGFFPLIRVARHMSTPALLRSLAPGFVSLEVSRIDDRTLAVHPDGGFASEPMRGLMRDSSHALQPGEVIHLTDMDVLVGNEFVDGWPLSVQYRFNAPLESRSLYFAEWHRDGLTPFSLPKVGHSVTLPAYTF